MKEAPETTRPARKWDGTGLLLASAVFLILFLFYVSVHPLVITDCDDWKYIAYTRSAIPLWGDWNPTRVLPEIMMSGVNTAGVFLLMPLLGDYQACVTASSAAAVAGAVALYVFSFYTLIRKKYSLGRSAAFCLSALFLIAHFAAFRRGDSMNEYLFHNYDLTYYFFYTIPALFSFSLIMLLSAKDLTVLPWSDKQMGSRGLLIAALYLALLSNLYQSGMLALWLCAAVARDACALRGKKERALRRFWARNLVKIIAVLFWLAVLLFEKNGGRAASLATSEPFGDRLRGAFSNAFDKIALVSVPFLIFSGACLLIGLVSAFIAFRKDGKAALLDMGRYAALGGLALLFLMLLCAETGVWNAYSMHIMLCLFFWFFLLLFSGLAGAMKRRAAWRLLLPLAVVVMLLETTSGQRTYRESTAYQRLDPAVFTAINQSIIDQAVAADRAGLAQVTVAVPKFDGADNWPLPDYMGRNVGPTLYKHGILRNPVAITCVVDPALNETYHIP